MDYLNKKSKMSRVTFLFLALILVFSWPLALHAVSTNTESLSYIIGYQDKTSGGIKEEFVDEPQSLENDWAIMAFSASGYDPSTVGETKTMIDFALNDACKLTVMTDIERRILALESAGIDTRELSSCNLPQKVIDATTVSGQIGDGLVSTVFGVLSLASSGSSVPESTISYIESHQQENGGWDSGYGAESNFTAQAVMALNASGQTLDAGVLLKAKEYFKSLQTETGGIKYDGGAWSTESDAFSDSYVLQAIYSLKENPNDLYWLRDGHSIIDDLQSLYNADGSYSFSKSYGVMNPVWTTAIALIGANENYLPVIGSNLKQWGSEPTVSPTATASASPTPSPTPDNSPSSTTTASVTSSSAEIAEEQTGTIAVFSKQEKPNVSLAQVSPQATSSVVTATATPSVSPGKVLSTTASVAQEQWRWIVVILIFSLITGAFIAFVELKYVKKNK